jgi:hypothetical protein
LKHLLEDNRHKLISKSKSSQKGRERFNKRNRSKVANTVKAMNSIDMNKLFKEDILTVNLPVQGETDDYIVKITFGGFLEILRDQTKGKDQVEFRDISRAAIIGFSKDDVFINCSCPDFRYRFAYYSTRNDFNSGAPENRPSKITNPNDTLGSACKHVLLVLNNTSWIIKVASVINNYIKYMERHYQKLYADVMYPMIYGKKYEEPVQLSLDDIDNIDNELQTDTDTIDTANKYNQDRTRFQKGNTSGVRFTSKDPEPSEDQIQIENPDDQL